jgi:hypothetical protein
MFFLNNMQGHKRIFMMSGSVVLNIIFEKPTGFPLYFPLAYWQQFQLFILFIL